MAKKLIGLKFFGGDDGKNWRQGVKDGKSAERKRRAWGEKEAEAEGE